MRSLCSGLWERKLFPALCVLGELLNLFLLSDSLPASWNLTPCTYRSVSVQDSRGLNYSSQKLSFYVASLLCILAALASPNSHLSSLLSKTETVGLTLGFPSPSLSLKTYVQAVSWAGVWNRRSYLICFSSIRNHSPTWSAPSFRRQFYFMYLVKFSSCLWQDSNLLSNYFFMGKVEVPSDF